MAQRNVQKIKRLSEPSAAASATVSQHLLTLETRNRALERDCENLKAELAIALAQIARLEEQRAQALSRLEGVIGSVKELMAEGA